MDSMSETELIDLAEKIRKREEALDKCPTAKQSLDLASEAWSMLRQRQSAELPVHNVPPLIEEVKSESGQIKSLRYHFHEGQQKAWLSQKRFILMLAGTRSGKTSFSTIWLKREMRDKGPGDYLAAAPTYKILDKALAPAIDSYFGRQLGLGRMNHSPFEFRISQEGHKRLWPNEPYEKQSRILFGHADDPESLEAMDARGAVLDEAGQKKFKLASWQAIQRRLSIHQGRALLPTTPYSLGWLYQNIFQRWEQAQQNHPDIDVISFDSRYNPAFPIAEYERAQRELPRWLFDLFYRGRFTRPAGLIYDCFDQTLHSFRADFVIPDEWPRYVGVDFGGINTFATFFAQEMVDGNPIQRFWAYREYYPRLSRSAAEHAKAILEGEPRIPTVAGGSRSEGQWRLEFARVGLPIMEPMIVDVHVGVNRAYGMFQRGEILVREDLQNLRDEIQTYSYELDESGRPTNVIDDPHSFHGCDSVRYFANYACRHSVSGADRFEWI